MSNPYEHIVYTEPEKVRVLNALLQERANQDAKWGEQNHPDGTGDHFQDDANMYRDECDLAAREGYLTWRDILLEEVFEALAESDPEKLRTELIQSAAVVSAWVEAIDRRASNV